MGTLCRSANNECDLPEHCTGDTGECPADMYKKNGIPCGGKADGLCYMGECPTLDNQCEQIWGYGERSKNCLKTVFFKEKNCFLFLTSNLTARASVKIERQSVKFSSRHILSCSGVQINSTSKTFLNFKF